MKWICSVCGRSTLGYIITTQGGTRTLSIAAPRSRRWYCKDCGLARIDEMDRKDRARARRRD